VEVGIPTSLLSQDSGEIVFNVLTGDATGQGLSGLGGSVYPQGLPDGNGYLLTNIVGADSATVRNPYHVRPHSHGGIVHRFHRASKIIAVEGMIVATKPEYRQQMTDWLRHVLADMVTVGVFGQPSDKAGRWFWKPAANPADLSNPAYQIRFHSVHTLTGLDVIGPAASEGSSPSGVAGPKTFTFELIADRPEALSYAQDSTDIDGFGSGFVPNAGNTDTWPVVKVYTGGPFTLFGPGGYTLIWGQGPDPAGYSILGSYIEVDMRRETMFWDGDGANALRYLDMANSDFFSIPPGGGDVSALGASSLGVLSNSAWVG